MHEHIISENTDKIFLNDFKKFAVTYIDHGKSFQLVMHFIQEFQKNFNRSPKVYDWFRFEPIKRRRIYLKNTTQKLGNATISLVNHFIQIKIDADITLNTFFLSETQKEKFDEITCN